MTNYQNIFARFQHKYDTWANWSNVSEAGKGGNLVLLKGELGICEIPASAGQVANEPVVLFKIGDGVKTFAELPWGSAKAADVYTWAKQTPEQFISWIASQNVIDGKTIKAYIDDKAAATLQSAKDYTDEAIEGIVSGSGYATKVYVDDAVEAEAAIARAAEQANANAISDIKAGGTFTTLQGVYNQAIADASTATTNAVNALKNGEVANNTAAIETLEENSATKDELNAVDAKFASYKTAEAQKAIDDAQDAKILALETNSATKAELNNYAAKTAVEKVASDLAAYESANDTVLAGVKATAEAAATQDYVNAELDKKVNVSDYNADKDTFATKTALEGVSVRAEKGITDAAAALSAAQEAQKDIDTFMGTIASSTEAVDTLAEVIALIESGNDVATGLLTDVNNLKAADVTLQANIDNKADKTVVNGIESRLGVVEGKVDVDKVSTAIETAVDELANGQVATNKTDLANEVARAKAAEEALDGRLDILEAIDHDAYKAAIEAAKTELSAEIDADVKALADGAVAANAGNISKNATAISNLESGKIETISAGTGLKAAQTASGNNKAWTISLDEAVVFVFNGGSSTVNVNAPGELGQ